MIQILAGVARALPAVARAGSGAARAASGAARAGGAAAKSGAVKGIESGVERGTNAAVTQMTYGALSHVGQRRQQSQQTDPNDPWPYN